MKQVLRALALVLALFAGTQARAGIPVIDAANLANSIQEVIAWGEQYNQMVSQIQQLENQYNQAVQQFNSIQGIRGMASLVNNPALTTYLPNDWNQALNVAVSPGGYTSLSSTINSIKAAAKVFDLGDSGLSPSSDAGKAFAASQLQAPTNRGLGQAGYDSTSTRIANIQQLLDKVNDAPDEKDILDLTARINAEQALVQNDANKLAVMAQLQQSQRDIAYQQAREIAMKSTKGTLPTGW
jgi:type IV secretion system protein VirB5